MKFDGKITYQAGRTSAPLNYPVWETYARHSKAARRDRPKHYPGGTLVRHWTDANEWRVKEQRLKSGFPADVENMTTDEYVYWFVRLNNLKDSK